MPRALLPVALVVAILVVIGVVFAVNRSNNTPSVATVDSSSPSVSSSADLNTTPSSTNTSTATVSPITTLSPSPSASSTIAAATTINYNSGVFTPNSVTVKVGDSVRFTNGSSGNINVDSNPHPVHTDYPPLNIGIILPGQTSTSVQFTKTGTFGYHNHLMPTEGGTIVVK